MAATIQTYANNSQRTGCGAHFSPPAQSKATCVICSRAALIAISVVWSFSRGFWNQLSGYINPNHIEKAGLCQAEEIYPNILI